jgi:hypothetical protein
MSGTCQSEKIHQREIHIQRIISGSLILTAKKAISVPDLL